MLNTKFLQSCTVLSALVLMPLAGYALPTGGVVATGNATIVDTANKTTINQDTNSKAIIDWDTFNIDNGETVRFNQGVNGVALNRIHDGDASKIFGTLRADGTVMLVNSNGFVFGQNSVVNVGNLVATSANITDSQFMNAGDKYRFNQAGVSDAKITVRDGAKIRVSDGGFAALVAPSVVNKGVIRANMGKVSLGGGQTFTLDLMGDGLVNLAVPSHGGKVTQNDTGKIITNGGTVQLTAKDAAGVVDSVINLDGIMQANNVTTHSDGRIILDAGTVNEGASLHTDADTVELQNENLKVDKDGIALVNDGGTVKLGKGTFTTDHTIEVNKTVTLQGKGKANTAIDASGVNGGAGVGVRVTADDTTLNGFALQNGSLNVEGDMGTGQKVNNVRVANVAVNAPNQLAEIQAIGTDGLHLVNVDVDGGGNSLAGIGIMNSSNVVLNNISTQGNLLAGVALVALGGPFDGNVDKVNIIGTNSYGEDIALATLGLGGDVTRVSAQGLGFQTKTDDLTAANIGLYHSNVNSAVNTALAVNGLLGGTDAVVEGLDTGAQYLTGNNVWYVGENGGNEMSIQAAVDAAQDGATVNVLDGTYHLNTYPNHYLMVDKQLTLSGDGEGLTTLDGSANTTYGIRVHADNVTLENFTLNGPTGAGAYGVKAEVDMPLTGDTVDNFAMNNVTVQGAGKTQVDVNSGNNLSFSNLTLKGNGTSGAGLFLTDDSNVAISNIHTENNAWGGVALSANHRDMSNIGFYGTNTYGEAIQMYTEGANGHTVSDIYAPEFDYMAAVSGVAGYGAYYQTLTPAIARALAMSPAYSTVEGLDEASGWTLGNNHFYVGNNGVSQMSIQTALNSVLNDGIVDVLDGTYTLGGTLDMNKSGVTLQGESRGGTILDASALSGYGIHVTGDHSTLQKFTLLGGNHGSGNYGIKVESPGATTDVNAPGYAQSVKDIDILNVIVRNFGRSEIDVNGAQNVDIKNVVADGNHTEGNGIAITDSNGVRLGGVTTKNNNWGGVRIAAEGKWHTPGTSNVSLQGINNHLMEANPLYTEEVNGAVVSDLYAPMFNYKLHSGVYDATKGPGVVQYLYQADLGDSVDMALSMGGDATIEGLDSGSGWTVGDNSWYVGQDGAEMSIQAAVDAASAGGLINVQDGTYHLNGYTYGYLRMDKALTLNGNGQGNTLLDASSDPTYGVRVLADNVTLQNFTLNGPTGSNAYGVKAEVVDPAISGPTIDNFTMNNVTVQGAGKTQVDVNAATFAAFNNVTVHGNGVKGNGFGITDAHDVTFNNVTADNNAWGDIRLTAQNGDTDKVRLKGNSHLNSANPMYTEQYAGHVVKDIYFPTMKFTLHSGVNDVAQGNFQTYYYTTEAKALAAADGLIGHGATDAVVQGNVLDGNSHNMGNNVFYADDNMSIQAAIDEAMTGGLVHLYNATYTTTSPYDLGGKDIALQGTGTQPVVDGGTVIDASTLTNAFTNGGNGSIADLTLLLASGATSAGPDGLLITRETTRQNGSFINGGSGIGGGDAFSLIEPAAGDDQDAKKDDDVEHMPLQQELLAVAQYFINTGNVVDQDYAVQALLAEAATNGQ